VSQGALRILEVIPSPIIYNAVNRRPASSPQASLPVGGQEVVVAVHAPHGLGQRHDELGVRLQAVHQDWDGGRLYHDGGGAVGLGARRVGAVGILHRPPQGVGAAVHLI